MKLTENVIVGKEHEHASISYAGYQLNCKVCEKDVIADSKNACLVWVENADHEVIDVYVVHKGSCDQQIRDAVRQQGCQDFWLELDDLKNPILWMKHYSDFMQMIQEGHFCVDAVKSIINIFWQFFPFISRQLTDKEAERYRSLAEFGLC